MATRTPASAPTRPRRARMLTLARDADTHVLFRLVHEGFTERLHEPATIWLQFPSGGWVAAFRLVPQQGTFVVAEFRVYPHGNPGTFPGVLPDHWWGDTRPREPMPAGGLTVRTIRELATLAPLEEHARAIVRQLYERHGDKLFAPKGLLGKMDLTRAVLDPGKPGKRGRKPDPDLRYAMIAWSYVDACERGAAPARVIAELQSCEPGTARLLVKKARDRGLLTPSPHRNRAGGELTDKARALLKEAETASRARKRKESAKTARRKR